MELAENGELFNYIAYGRPFEERFARYYFSQILSGLHTIHSQSLAHRDIKAENILLDANFNIKIIDLGYVGRLYD